MDAIKLIGILLIVAGGVGLAYGGFNYPKDRDEANIGSLHMSITKDEHVSIPLWAGVGALVMGGVLLVVPMNRKS